MKDPDWLQPSSKGGMKHVCPEREDGSSWRCGDFKHCGYIGGHPEEKMRQKIAQCEAKVKKEKEKEAQKGAKVKHQAEASRAFLELVGEGKGSGGPMALELIRQEARSIIKRRPDTAIPKRLPSDDEVFSWRRQALSKPPTKVQRASEFAATGR